MIEWFTGELGAAALPELVAALDPRWRTGLCPARPALGLVASGWYDEELASELAARIVDLASARMSEAEALRAIGRVTVERSLGRISRAALEWFASPETTAVSAQMFWRLYHSTGSISASVAGSTMHAVGHWGLHGARWCAVVGTSAVHVLELTGCKDVHVERHTCGGGGDRSCEMTLRWSGR